MIDIVEIRDENRAQIGIIDTAKSIIWNIKYYGVGDFEIYAPFTAQNEQLLKVGYYVTRPDERNVGIIEHINIAYSPQDGRTITASGSFAKSILARRLIYNMIVNNLHGGYALLPVISKGNVETAVRKLVNENIIAAKDAARNVSFLELGAVAGLTSVIVDENGNTAQKQTSYGNLREYTDGVLQEYAAGAYIGIDRATQKLQYIIYEGVDRSKNNAAGRDPIIFSQEYDNLLTSSYDYNTAAAKNTAIIGGAGEGIGRYIEILASAATGIDRREVFIEAADQSRTYRDAADTEQTYTSAEYSQMLITRAKQGLATLITTETMDGKIDITNSGLRVGVDFYAGDIITMQDNELNKYVNARIISITEVQDDNGYNINVVFGE